MDSHVIISCSSSRIGRSGRGACSLQASPFQAQRSGAPRHCVRGRPLQGTRPLGKRANTIATTMARRGHGLSVLSLASRFSSAGRHRAVVSYW